MNQKSKTSNRPQSALHLPSYLDQKEKKEIIRYLQSLHPIWEMRYSQVRPLQEGQQQRRLLRPVYWLGNWQFACLDYYHPPKGLRYRCVTAEGFPPVLQKLIQKMESLVHTHFAPKDIPQGWHLNTCLINYYGDHIQNGKVIDCARVGEHKDFEPGPVTSLSLGERALFQFVSSRGKDHVSETVLQQWLGDGDLQIFGGDKFKKQLFHRVQRVDRKEGVKFDGFNEGEDFQTRRINFTFRYVPNDHIYNLADLPEDKQQDIASYIEGLAQHSQFWKQNLEALR